MRLTGRATSLARPKSVIFSVPSSEISTLDGLRSRWTRPARWAAVDRSGEHLDGPGRFARVHLRRREPGRQGPAAAVLEGEIGEAVVLSDVVDLDDVRMLEPGDGLALPAKSFPLGRSRVGAREDHLQGDDASQSAPACLVDDSHAAATEDAQDLIVRSDLRRPVRHRRPNRGDCGPPAPRSGSSA